MPAEKTATADQVSPAQAEGTATAREARMTATSPDLAIGDTLTVVSGRIGGTWIVEDESGTVYTATPVE